MLSSNTRPHRTPRARMAVVTAITAVMATVGLATPADASVKSSGIWYSGDKTARCASGKYGFLYIEGGHVSYKMVYWKTGTNTHWHNTAWTGFNGGDVLVKILGKTGGNRYARAYIAVAPDTKHSMSSLSKLHFYTLCDSRNLTGDNYGDAFTRLNQVWRRSYWKVFR